jgi:hypothetical protein
MRRVVRFHPNLGHDGRGRVFHGFGHAPIFAFRELAEIGRPKMEVVTVATSSGESDTIASFEMEVDISTARLIPSDCRG